MLHIIWSIIIGFVIGLIARAIMPGAQNLGFIVTTLLGIGGSILGGLVGRLFSKPEPGTPFHPAGIIMSIIGALILLFLWGKFHPMS
ncbi:MAG: GlsB/YeaQ/YmgE family stress response membrane protein [Acidobacteriota bacterium]|nr:GlsB/YeaQ/YmgE family stress response membrane protein [Acidobacteriota bacterium]MDQ6939894.1 GlsB/YeaQ/YmgE family stress response membrane protein [Verrucomicrobiota bacterium]